MPISKFLAAAALALMSGAATSAAASNGLLLPPPVITGSAAAGRDIGGPAELFDAQPMSGGLTAASAGIGDTHGVSNASVTTAFNQSVSATSHTNADVSAPFDYSSIAGGSLSYELVVNGPENIEVPIVLSGRGVTFAGDALAQSEIDYTLAGYVNHTGGLAAFRNQCAWATAAQCGPIDYESDLTLFAFTPQFSGSTLRITLYAAAGTMVFAGGGASDASAFIDPQAFIDPGFLLDHPDYSLTFSPGILPEDAAPGVPEPASWALMIAGFGLAGAALRRRRAAPA